MRRSGCDFAYLQEAGWRPPAVAFLFASCLLIYPAILAIQTLAFGEHILQGLSKLRAVDPAYEPILKRLLGFSVLCECLGVGTEGVNQQGRWCSSTCSRCASSPASCRWP